MLQLGFGEGEKWKQLLSRRRMGSQCKRGMERNVFVAMLRKGVGGLFHPSLGE